MCSVMAAMRLRVSRDRLRVHKRSWATTAKATGAPTCVAWHTRWWRQTERQVFSYPVSHFLKPFLDTTEFLVTVLIIAEVTA